MKTGIIAVTIIILSSCHWAKDKAKDGLHKSGEIAGKVGAEIADGISTGVEKTFSNTVIISNELTGLGIHAGRVIIAGTDSTSDNIVSVYLIFEKGFHGNLLARVTDSEKREFGRASVKLETKAGDAGYYDFRFDRRTNIDRGDSIFIDLLPKH